MREGYAVTVSQSKGRGKLRVGSVGPASCGLLVMQVRCFCVYQSCGCAAPSERRITTHRVSPCSGIA